MGNQYVNIYIIPLFSS